MTKTTSNQINTVKQALGVAKAIQASVASASTPPEEGTLTVAQHVLPHSVVKGTRGYIEGVTNQINGCYDKGLFDACAVMIRRLIETLIIEAFEHHQISDHIKGPTGDFLYMKDLIAKTVAETKWNLGRNTKQALPRLKEIGDKSAHSRHYVAHRRDIDKAIADVRTVAQELVYLAGLK